LKEDSCNASQVHQVAFDNYGTMRDALNSTKREIYFSLCGWNSWYAPVGNSLGNQWRIAGDCNVWSDVLNAIDVNSRLADYAGPGYWNDPDMLIGTSNQTAAYLSQPQSRTMFSMWAVMAAPLLIGSDIRQLNPFDLETFSNSEVIAIDQDPLGEQGIRIVGTNFTDGSKANIWGRNIESGVAAIFLNNDKYDREIGCDVSCMMKMGFEPNDVISIRDVWSHTNNGTTSGQKGLSPMVVADGGSVTLILTLSSSF